MLGSSLKDLVIYTKDMVKLGKVTDFEVDPEEMKVTHLILELEDQAAKEIFGKSPKLRHTKGRVAVFLIENLKDAIILKEPLKDLKDTIEKL